MTEGDIQWIKKQTMSNRLVDILDDEKKVADLNEDYHYRQSVLPRLNQLLKKILKGPKTYIDSEPDFVKTLIEDLKDNPHHRLLPLEMEECNKLWKKYK